ncbi:TIGR03905 family TSCPD domain-containing protein [bacterium]|nr:TIGR03905 family TSCPD domain-containing protein [bacterium]
MIQYQPKGVCSRMMQIKIKDNIIEDIEIIGGCAGNLIGIGQLVKGMNINDIIPKISGIPCGKRPTSCPDQLSVALKAYLNAKNQSVEINV